ncbi:MAG: type II CAAX prenyl endopeptidase Rce1 family protein [Nitrosopumilaceae archaeon]
MNKINKALQGLGIPYAALISIVFGMMVLSFPIGAFVVFNSNIGNEINFEYPLSGFNFFLGGIGFEVPIEFELGDAFIVIWILFLILFTISFLGPKRDLLKTLTPMIAEGKQPLESNYLVTTIKWFSILVLISGMINFVQESVGITIEAPAAQNELIRFYDVTIAPIIEEIGFRVLLIGLPLFVFYSHKTSFSHFFKSLWNPSDNLDVFDSRKAIILIVVVAVFFGVAHILSGEPWSTGKFTQATVGGIIIGWVYFRMGLVSAILIHWATNYFVFSYVYMISDFAEVTVEQAFEHSLMMTFEILFIALGIISIAIMFLNRYSFKKKERLEI